MKKFLLVIVISLFVSTFTHAQDFLKSKDLSTLKVESLSDDDILKYKQQLQQSGITESKLNSWQFKKVFLLLKFLN